MLPTYQDCHEMWSKKRRREMREQQEQKHKQRHQPTSHSIGSVRVVEDSADPTSTGR